MLSFRCSFAKTRVNQVSDVMKKALQMRRALQSCFKVEMFGSVQDATSLHTLAKFIGPGYTWAQVEAFFRVVSILEELRNWGNKCSCHDTPELMKQKELGTPCNQEGRR